MAFFFIATEKADKVKVVLVAAGLMAVLGLIPGAEVFFSEHEGIDWNVIFLLLGMMIIVGVIKQTGLFDYLAIWAAKRSRGRPYRLMVMLMVITAVASPFLDNVTTIMLVAPVTIVVCDRLRIAAQPYLIAEVLASNIGGAATLIGDPPNIIIGSRAGLTFNDFLVHMAPIVVVIFAVFVLLTQGAVPQGPACHARATSPRSWPCRSGGPSPTRACSVRCLVGARRGRRRVRAAFRAAPRARRSSRWWAPGVMVLVSRVDVADICARSSGARWCSSWACSSWSGGWCTPG